MSIKSCARKRKDERREALQMRRNRREYYQRRFRSINSTNVNEKKPTMILLYVR